MAFEWTKEVVSELKKLHDDGTPYSEIARRLKCGSRNAVIGKVHRMGWERRGAITPGHRSPRKLRAPKMKNPFRKPLPPIPPAKKINGQDVSILDLTDTMCRWPIGEPQDDDFHFCGNTVQDQSRYCAAHHARAYRPTPKNNRG